MGNVKELRKKRRTKVGDPDFAPPDGGWGWMVVFACGFSNLSTFPMFQQFGLVFREKFELLQISNSQTTTIINLNSAFNSCVGLLNGPLFRIYSYRQVAMFGSCLVISSLFISTFCESFWTYLIFYSIFYGSGIGITQSSNALALNTYFKKKRRIATGISWTTTALGPIVWPYIITFLLEIYGMEGTLMVFSAFAGHAFLCSLLLQPVEWHTGLHDENAPFLKDTEKVDEEEVVEKIYEIIEPGTPMMAPANDGWYSLTGSRLSLASNKTRLSSAQNSMAVSKRPSYNNLAEARSKRNSLQENKERKKEKKSQTNASIREEIEEMNETVNYLALPNEKDVLKTAAKKLAELKDNENFSLWQKISIFFDFDLFKDPIYLNLMLGITIANFAEINFSILTPMVLKEFNFGKYQTATFMSLLGATDIIVRFFVPFIAEKIGWENKTFFLVGVLSMAFGRIILVHTQTYEIGLLVAVIIGAGKGLRTIFMALVIPSHVSLERLPAASGLQLATSGLLFLIMGPVVGWIRDAVNNYVITLHILNIMTYITTIAWIIEMILTRKNNMIKNVN